MPELSTRTVGFLIAYIIPGFLLLWGLSFVSPDVRALLIGIGDSGPSVGGALLGFVTSLGAGMTASLFRWAFVDTAEERGLDFLSEVRRGIGHWYAEQHAGERDVLGPDAAVEFIITPR